MIAKQIRHQRKLHRLTQAQLAELLGVDFRLISKWECGVCRPRGGHLAHLCEILQFEPATPIASLPLVSGRGRRSAFRTREVEPDPESTLLQRSWRLRQSARPLWRWFEDHRVGLIATYARQAPCDSSLEAVVQLALMQDCARPRRSRPEVDGFRVYPVVNRTTRLVQGDRPVPALLHRRGGLRTLWIPQVALLVCGQLRVLDFLVGIKKGRHVLWANVEVDGPGHLALDDSTRDRALALPVLRFTGRQLLQASRLDQIYRDLEALMKPRLAA